MTQDEIKDIVSESFNDDPRFPELKPEVKLEPSGLKEIPVVTTESNKPSEASKEDTSIREDLLELTPEERGKLGEVIEEGHPDADLIKEAEKLKSKLKGTETKEEVLAALVELEKSKGTYKEPEKIFDKEEAILSETISRPGLNTTRLRKIVDLAFDN
jgi:NAD+--asparagine ADP-ribosyltransferase